MAAPQCATDLRARRGCCESLQEHVLIVQKTMEVTVFRRSASWTPAIVRAREAAAELQSIGLSLALTEIYRDTALG